VVAIERLARIWVIRFGNTVEIVIVAVGGSVCAILIESAGQFAVIVSVCEADDVLYAAYLRIRNLCYVGVSHRSAGR